MKLMGKMSKITTSPDIVPITISCVIYMRSRSRVCAGSENSADATGCSGINGSVI
jgi:hypothetical protein